MESIDAEAKAVTLAGGVKLGYDKLICTIPLDITLRQLGKPECAPAAAPDGGRTRALKRAGAGG